MRLTKRLFEKIAIKFKQKLNMKLILSFIFLVGIVVVGFLYFFNPSFIELIIKGIGENDSFLDDANFKQDINSSNDSETSLESAEDLNITEEVESENITTEVLEEIDSGGSSGGGGGNNVCIPSKTCLDYLGQCSIGLSDGCSNILNCFNNCQAYEFCNITNYQCELSCTNDAGCLDEGYFCDNNLPYNCTLNTTNMCYYRINQTTCSGEEVCMNGSCEFGMEINSCQKLNQENMIYLLNQSIINNTLTDSCINITSENITLNCQSNSIISDKDVSGIFSNQKNIRIKNCNITLGNNSGVGMEIIGNNTQIINNTLNSQYSGIYLHQGSSNNLIENNIIKFNTNNGIHLSLSSNNSIVDNDISHGDYHGILMLFNSSNNLVQKNIISNNGWYALHIGPPISSNPDFSNNNQIIDNNINQNGIGIYAKTSNNLFENNFVNGSFGRSISSNGIYIFGGYGGHNNTVMNNTINYNERNGIRIRYSQNNSVINNTVKFNQLYGLEVGTSALNNNFIGNIICSNILEDAVCSLSQLIFENNNCGSGSVCGGVCNICS